MVFQIRPAPPMRDPLACCRILLLVPALLLAGCATHIDRLQPIREQFFAGQISAARQTVVEVSAKKKKEADVLALDQAIIELSDGRPREAEQILRRVRDRFDTFEQKDIKEELAVYTVDDTARSYSGEDYERVLIRAFLAISNLMTDGSDAGAYALQLTEKQQQVIAAVTEKSPEHPEVALAYKQVALGPYIRAALAEESPLTLDEAVRARTDVVSWEPEFRDAASDLQRAKFDKPVAPGRGVVYVFALVGRGPIKEETIEIPTQAALLVADRVISSFTKRGLTPTLAPIKIPKVMTFYSPIDHVAVTHAGQPVGQTATIVNIGQMARDQQEARYPEIIGRAVARRTIKKAALYAVKEGAQTNAEMGLLVDVAGVAWEASEKADTRCWGLLPDRIQVARIELPSGPQQLALQPSAAHGKVGAAAAVTVNVPDGRNTYVLANFPEYNLVGQIVTSGTSNAGGRVTLE